jgi:hypothetical protein
VATKAMQEAAISKIITVCFQRAFGLFFVTLGVILPFSHLLRYQACQWTNDIAG